LKQRYTTYDQSAYHQHQPTSSPKQERDKTKMSLCIKTFEKEKSLKSYKTPANTDMATNIPDGAETPLVPDDTFAYSDDHESLSIHASPNYLPLYNADSTLDIPRDVADGFLILLSAGRVSARTIRKEYQSGNVNKRKTRNKGKEPPAAGGSTAHSPKDMVDHSAIQLCFAALTQGNVIEATFGVETTGGLKRSKYTSERAYNAAKNAKTAISDAAYASDAIQQQAVDTYCKCFEIVIMYDIDLERIGFVTWCLRHQKVREAAEKQLQDAFSQLNEAITAST